MNKKEATVLREKAKTAAAQGDFFAACLAMEPFINSPEATFDDKLNNLVYHCKSNAWLQADILAENIEEEAHTAKQKRRISELRAAFLTPPLSQRVKGTQYGAPARIRGPVDVYQYSF